MVNNDNELVKSFLKGNQEAFNILANKYKQKIYWHTRRMLGNHLDADEVTQEVLIVMYDKLNTFKFDSSLFTWIYSITTRRCLNYIKKRNIKRFFSIESEEITGRKSEDDIVKNFENKEKLNRLDEILEQLPVKQREVFILRNFEELSYEEISKITGKSIGGLKANYFHALKKILEKNDEE
jgi:RNA polymerase sigma-70 factor (ECF subfamily)